jgi:YbbR domain-containing protein
MLRSIAPESKTTEVAVQNRELVFSNVEVEMAKKKSNSKYTHYKALFNLNKSL